MAATEPGRPAGRRGVAGLVLAGAVGAALSGPGAHADDRVVVDGHYYLDSDDLEVWHPHAGVRVDASDEVSVGASYDADVISAATIDVRTSASPRGFRETRHGIAADVVWAPSSTLRLGLSTSGSFAPDYASGTGGVRLSIEDPGRVHTFSVAASGSYAGVGRVGDQANVGEAFAGGLTLGWAAVVSRALVVDLAAAAELSGGYLESPYRFVSLYDPASPTSRVAVPESLPDQRLRGSVRGRLRFAPTDEVFLRGAYRFHADDWGVAGHTVEAELSVVVVPALTLSASFRFLGQRAATFYRGRYETLPLLPEHAARDRELAATTTLSGGLALEVRLPTVLEGVPALFARGEIAHTRLYDTPLLPERLAGIVGAGLSFTR